MAEKLGETELVMLYTPLEFKTKTLEFKTKVKLIKGLLIKENKDLNKLNQKSEFIISQNPTRDMVENKKITHYFDSEDQKKADFIHHRNSGVNQVHAKLMHDKEKKYCFSYSLLLNSLRKDQLIGRFSQNKRLLNKYKVGIKVYSFARKPYELRAKHERDALLKII